jgi:hypothetical protein
VFVVELVVDVAVLVVDSVIGGGGGRESARQVVSVPFEIVNVDEVYGIFAIQASKVYNPAGMSTSSHVNSDTSPSAPPLKMWIVWDKIGVPSGRSLMPMFVTASMSSRLGFPE